MAQCCDCSRETTDVYRAPTVAGERRVRCRACHERAVRQETSVAVYGERLVMRDRIELQPELPAKRDEEKPKNGGGQKGARHNRKRRAA